MLNYSYNDNCVTRKHAVVMMAVIASKPWLSSLVWHRRVSRRRDTYAGRSENSVMYDGRRVVVSAVAALCRVSRLIHQRRRSCFRPPDCNDADRDYHWSILWPCLMTATDASHAQYLHRTLSSSTVIIIASAYLGRSAWICCSHAECRSICFISNSVSGRSTRRFDETWTLG